MTITTLDTRIAYAADGISTSFAVPFPFFGPDEITVYQTTGAGVQTTLVRGTDYTVTGGGGGTGTVTAVSAPAAGLTWTIVRTTAVTQNLAIPNGQDMPGPALERALDRLTAAAQEAQAAVTRAIRVPEGQATPPPALPTAADRAGKVLAFDSNGDPTAGDFPDGSTPISTPMAPVVGAASLAAARTALGVPRRIDAVRDYGADNTGVAAVDTAVQNAINAAVAGQVIYLAGGAYKFATGVTMKPGVEMEGDGPYATTLIAAANSVQVLKYTAAATVNGITVRRLGISGGGFSSVYGIHLDGTDSAKRISLVNIEDVYIATCARGINARFLANYRFENVKANVCAIGFYIDQCADGEVDGGWAQNGSAAGIYITGAGGAYDEGIRITGFSTNGQNKGIEVSGQDWGQVTGCSLTTCPGGAMNLIQVSNWQITGSQFAVGGGSPAAPGISADVNCVGLQIADNIIALNTFGLNLLGQQHVVKGNRLTGNSNVDINLQATKCVVEGNVCNSTGSAASILEQAGSDYNSISGNTTSGTVTTVGANTKTNGDNVVY